MKKNIRRLRKSLFLCLIVMLFTLMAYKSVSSAAERITFSTDIYADINDKFAKVKLTHIYYNPYDDYLDTCFKFPKGLYQVFDGIEAEIDGKKIKGLIGLRKNIGIKYVTEVAKGSTVIKTEELCPASSKVKNDIFITQIGNIPPKKDIKITFSFIKNLDVSLIKKFQFILPFVLTPRYVPVKKTLNLYWSTAD